MNYYKFIFKDPNAMANQYQAQTFENVSHEPGTSSSGKKKVKNQV
jgi:hypothetical protein